MNLRFRPAPLFCLLALFCSACNGSDPAPKKAELPEIAVLLYSGNDIYIGNVFTAIEKALAGKAHVSMHDAATDQKTQDAQMDALLGKGVDVFLVNQVDPKNASIALDKAKKAEIPVIFFNREPDLESLKSYSRAAFVGTEAEEAGRLQGDMVAQLWARHPEYDRNGDGVLEFVLFQGNADNPEAIARSEFSVRQAREKGVPLQQIGETMICDWSMDLASAAMRLAWATHGDNLELILANNDAMALGAISVLAEHGYNNGDPARFIPVLGVDAVAPAIEAIGKGVMSATVRQDAQAMGEAVAAMALNAVQGKALLEGTGLKWDASGVAVRIPYAPYVGPEQQ